MNQITMTESSPSLRAEDIAGLETRLGIKLPDDYRAFLLAHNGGRPEPSVFPVKDAPFDDHGILNWLYCICPDDGYDLTRVVKVFQDRIPQNLLPIGDDPGGNQVCMSVSGSDRGTIYFWDHEDEYEEGVPPDYHNVYFVANSLEALLESLEPIPEDW